MKHIKIVRHPNEIGSVLLDAKFAEGEVDLEEIRNNWESLFKEYNQIAYCVETGDIIAVIDKNGYLQCVVPGYETVSSIED